MTENDDIAKIETTGDFSPGIVKGNYTINQTIIQQYETKRRIQWRNLETVIYPIISDSDNSRAKCASDMGFVLHKVFSDEKFRKFTGLIKKSKNGQDVSYYELFCHQIEFCSVMQQEQKEYISNLISFQEQFPRSVAREKMAELYIKPIEKFYHEWNLVTNLSISERWSPIEFIYDRAKKRVVIHDIPSNEMNLANYPDGLSTTSEMLVLLSGFLSAHFAFFDDALLLILEKNYPLMKLFIDLVDKRVFHLDRLRINANDYEEWDYVNVSFDNEVEIKKKMLEKGSKKQ